MADLKQVYGAVNEEAALYALEEFKEKWDSKYPQIYRKWESNWTDLSGFFKYPTEMRRLIYTTNAVMTNGMLLIIKQIFTIIVLPAYTKKSM